MKRRLCFLALIVLPWAVAWLLLSGIEYRMRDPPNYTLIEPGLWLGGDEPRPPPGTDVVVNLRRQPDPYRVRVVRHDPIKDAAPAPPLGWLRDNVAFVESHRAGGRTVFVHCRRGVSRSGMVAAAVLMKEHGWTRDESLAFLREKRPQVRPNPAFMPLLKEWEAELESGRAP